VAFLRNHTGWSITEKVAERVRTMLLAYGYKCPMEANDLYHYLEEGASIRYYCPKCGRIWKIEEVANAQELKKPSDIQPNE